MRKLSAIFLLICSTAVSGESRYGDTSWRFYLELDQMLVLKAGSEYSLSPRWGVKGGLGTSIFGSTLVGYELAGVYHTRDSGDKFQWDLEFGLPIAYFDVLEGNVVDWDPMVDDPYAGWLPGISLVWGYRFPGGGVLSVKTGVMVFFEYHRDSGWRDEVLLLPEVSVQWQWRSRTSGHRGTRTRESPSG